MFNNDVSSLANALATLFLFIGPAGVVGIVVAYLGYKKGRKDRDYDPNRSPMMGIATIYADRAAIEELAKATFRLCDTFDEVGRSVRELAMIIRNRN